MDFREAALNAGLDALTAELGANPDIKIFTGAAPAAVTDADSGTEIASGDLPADAFADAVAGVSGVTGTWTVTGIAAAGGGTNAGHFRIYDSGGGVWAQGTVGAASSGEDLELQNISIADTQVVSITAFNLTLTVAP